MLFGEYKKDVSIISANDLLKKKKKVLHVLSSFVVAARRANGADLFTSGHHTSPPPISSASLAGLLHRGENENRDHTSASEGSLRPFGLVMATDTIYSYITSPVSPVDV